MSLSKSHKVGGKRSMKSKKSMMKYSYSMKGSDMSKKRGNESKKDKTEYSHHKKGSFGGKRGKRGMDSKKNVKGSKMGGKQTKKSKKSSHYMKGGKRGGYSHSTKHSMKASMKGGKMMHSGGKRGNEGKKCHDDDSHNEIPCDIFKGEQTHLLKPSWYYRLLTCFLRIVRNNAIADANSGTCSTEYHWCKPSKCHRREHRGRAKMQV